MKYSRIGVNVQFKFQGSDDICTKNVDFSYSNIHGRFRLNKGENPDCEVIYNEIKHIIPERAKTVRGKSID
jgi:hypothetical protein